MQMHTLLHMTAKTEDRSQKSLSPQNSRNIRQQSPFKASLSSASAAEPAIEPDGGQSDTDSAIAFTIDGSDITSITSSIKNYVYENGRRYHSYCEGNMCFQMTSRNRTDWI
ncbi:hypothetical protein M432DRAFT_167532 [Thermoascus aurantiacus ATCC 26904]